MKFTRSRLSLLAVAASCVALGVGISAITSAGASTSTHHAGVKAAHARAGKHGLLARAVQGSAVVKTKSGFATVTLERGTVTSVSGQSMVMNEGTRKATYKSETVTIPSSAKVRVNRQLSSLSAVKPGMRVLVLTLPKRTVVIARTPKTA